MADDQPQGGYRLRVDPDSTWYQYDRSSGGLRAVRGRDLDLSRPFFSAPGGEDADHDQGEVCTHEECAPDAPVVAGRCGWCGRARGEWVEVGYMDRAEVDGVLRFEGGPVYVAPVGTPPPDQRPIGPPLSVRETEHRDDGVHVTVEVPAGHPAHDAITAGIRQDRSIPHGLEHRRLGDDAGVVRLPRQQMLDLIEAAVEATSTTPPARTVNPQPQVEVAVNGPYVNLDGGGAGQAPTPAGLGREHIARRQAVPPPASVTLPQALLGQPAPAEDADQADDDGPVRYVANRRDRRRAARRRRRG